MGLKIVKGMRDLQGEEIEPFQLIEAKAREIFALYNFQEIRTPILEQTELFARGVGEETDIVGKEMYLLEDRRGQSLAMRPEGTASVVRSVITNNLMQQNKLLRYFYFGPMFRFERPQKGRYRQFYQIGVEYFGVSTPDADLEMILMLKHLFREINLQKVSFQINSIGCQAEECRPAYKVKLQEFLQGVKEDLCENCIRRIDTNPLRVLDCKVPKCSQLTNDAPRIDESLCGDCDEHYKELQSLLKEHKVEYSVNSKLVRGLDYYSRTVFEVYSDGLGAQNAAGGGGRFDGLFQVYDADPVPSIGFALGLDRLAMLIDVPEKKEQGIFVVGHDRTIVGKIVASCREAGFSCMYDPFLSSMKSQFRQANRLKVKKVLILGGDELKNNTLSVKDMASSQQTTINREDLVQHLNESKE